MDQVKKIVFEKNAFEFEVLVEHVKTEIGLIILGPNLNLKQNTQRFLEKNSNAQRFPKFAKNQFWFKSTWSTLCLGIPINYFKLCSCEIVWFKVTINNLESHLLCILPC